MRISDWSSDVCSSDLDHPLAARRTLAPEDLADARFVSLASEDAARARIDRLFEQASVRRRIVVETQYSVTICNLVRNGVGISLVNPLALEGLDRTGLTVVPFKPAVHFRTLDRKSVVTGTRVSGRLDLVGRRVIKKKT